MSQENVLDEMYHVLQERKKIQTWYDKGEISEEEFHLSLENIQRKMNLLRTGYGGEPKNFVPTEKSVPVDWVEQPAHYANRKYEVWDVMEDTMTHEQFIGYNLGACLKYLMRWDKKGYPLQDLEKASRYLNKLIETIKEEQV